MSSDVAQSAANETPEELPDAGFVESLLAFDLALSLGEADASKSSISPSPSKVFADLEEAKECLRLLERLWPRPKVPESAVDSRQCEMKDAVAVTDDASAGQLDQAGIHRLGRFEVLRELGRGGSGIVYHAVDTRRRRQVALKVPRPEFLFTAEMRGRFVREAQAAAELDHPNIVPIHEPGEIGPVCYIASELCAGPTLATWLKQHRKPLTGPLAAQLVAILADAVQHAHARGILHRDIKPSNILLDSCDSDHTQSRQQSSVAESRWREFIPKLTDFGLA